MVVYIYGGWLQPHTSNNCGSLFLLAGGGASETTAHVEHENFLRAVVNATPMAVMKPGSSWMSDSMLSLDSISLYSSGGGGGAGEYQLATPDTGRKGSSSSSNPFAKAINHVRYAAGGGGGGG